MEIFEQDHKEDKIVVKLKCECKNHAILIAQGNQADVFIKNENGELLSNYTADL